MAEVRVALLQLPSPGPDPEKALSEGMEACREARRLGADIALFPEMWSIGYAPACPGAFDRNFDPADPRHLEPVRAWQARAVEAGDPFPRAFAALAAELRMAIVLTFLERWPGFPRNTAVLYDREGRACLTYAKVHTCAFSGEAFCTPGFEFPVADLDTRAGKVRIGLMTCFDREFPESARVLAVQGAELILVPNACDLEANRLAQIRTRAFENAVGLAVANYPPPVGNGSSVACSPIAFAEDERPLDPWILQAPVEAGIYLAVFDLAAIRRWRRDEPWGLPWRRPLAYGTLCLPGPGCSAQPGVPVGPGSAVAKPGPGEVGLRPAPEGDFSTLQDLDPKLLSAEESRREACLRRRLAGGRVSLVLRGGEPVGYLVLTREFFDRPFLESLFVRERDRGAGLGTAVLGLLVAGRSEELFTSTNRSNARMIHLLGKTGFAPCGFVDHLDPGDPELIYRWTPPGGGPLAWRPTVAWRRHPWRQGGTTDLLSVG